ncbi:hypothetical protein C0J52_05249 [Blattella germanica]|nr:hypothetical protein C0J52_05249 [Blattella germanica]
MDVIENKKTDSISNKQRAESWEKVSLCFNALQDSGPRTAEQLKNAYDCIKRKARKDQSLDKVEIYKTGGGAFKKKLDETGEKALAMLPTHNAPLPAFLIQMQITMVRNTYSIRYFYVLM